MFSRLVAGERYAAVLDGGGGMKRRGHGDGLTDAECEALHADLRRGIFQVRYLASKYNLSERTVQVHRAKINGTLAPTRARSENSDARHLITPRLCKCDGCIEQVPIGISFCAAHEPIKPPNLNRLMAGR